MKKTNWVLLAGLILISLAVGIALFQNKDRLGSGNSKEVDWQDLGELDYVSGSAPQKLKDLDGKDVRIPGFMVPLEDDSKAVKEFLLVPSPQACIHVPPPPPNQMVLVEMEEGSEAAVAYGPIWIYGTLSLKSKKHMYGESSFTMKGRKIEPYK
jgi:uncharacterized protein